MKHPSIEFILACPCCNSLAEYVKELAPSYPNVETRVYEAGKDVEYVQKYGVMTSSILIINESEAVTEHSKAAVLEAFEKAAASA